MKTKITQMLLVCLLLLLSSVVVLGMYCCSSDGKKITVAFYNTENLFDTIDAPYGGDDDFAPKGKNAWTPERYQKKLDNIYKVLSGILGGKKVPALIGLSEVENETVLQDLIKKTPIADNYGIVHYDSPDERGIDVALLYDPTYFTLTASEPIKVEFDFEPSDRTRDILYVQGKLGKQDVHVFVNHWPSRREGMEKSSPKREAAAKIVQTKVSSILQKDGNAKIIIMGDLNDHPDNKSVAEVLKAKNDCSKPDAAQLYDLSAQFQQKGLGTHRYEGKWGVLDHIIVSGALLQNTKGLKTSPKDVHIFKQDWMMYNDTRYGGKSPSATYGGTKYYGGYSDHLPTYMTLRY